MKMICQIKVTKILISSNIIETIGNVAKNMEPSDKFVSSLIKMCNFILLPNSFCLKCHSANILDFFKLLFDRPTANFGPRSRRDPH